MKAIFDKKILFLIVFFAFFIIFSFWFVNQAKSSPSLNWTRLYTGTEPDYYHAASMPGDGSLIRARITLPVDSRKLYYQRVTNPGPGSNFSAWTYANQYNVAVTAVASQGAEVSIFWIRSSREIYQLQSNNNGASWGSAQLIDYIPSYTTAIAAVYKPNGDIAVFFTDQASLYVKKRVGGSWQSKVLWNKTTGDLSGVGVVYDGDWNLLVAGKDTSGNYKIWALIYGDGEKLPANNWSNLVLLRSAPSSQYEYQNVSLDKSDIYRAFYIEKFTGSGAYSRPYYIQTSAHFVDLPWSIPEHFDNLSAEYGIAIAHKDNTLWSAAPYGVWRVAPTLCKANTVSCSSDSDCCSGNCQDTVCSPVGYTADGVEWANLYSGFEPDYYHTAASAGDSSLVRLRAGPPADGRKLYYQRVVNPGPSSDFSSWTWLGGEHYNALQVASCASPQPPPQRVIGASDVSIQGSSMEQFFTLDRFQASYTSQISQIKINLAATGAQVKVAIYADNSGEPGVLLNALNTPQSCVDGWNTINFPSTSITQGVYYWLAFVTDSARVNYHTASSSVRYKTASFNGFNFPNPAGTGFSSVGDYYFLIAGWGVVPEMYNVSQVYLRGEALGPSVRYRESNDNGASWGSWQLIDYSASSATAGLTVAYKPNGDLAIFWVDQSMLYVKKRISGLWQSKTLWDKTTGDLSGIAAVYGQDWNLLVTGKDTSGNYKIWSLVYGDGGKVPVNTWSSLTTLISAPSSQYEYQNISLDKSDIYRAFYVEKFTGIDSYSLPYTIDGSGSFVDAIWSNPKQFNRYDLFSFLAYDYGLSITHYGDLLWLASPYGVWQNPTLPTVETEAATNIQLNQAQLNGDLTGLGGADYTEVWFEWGEGASYGKNTFSQIKTDAVSFQDTITGLSPNTTYHFRAKAKNQAGISYGVDSDFTTLDVPPCLSHNVWGWAWSENIGWISFSCKNQDAPEDYGVDINETTGIFSGYAWSENIGWISFNTTDLAGCPTGTCQAKLDFENNQVSGWAKVLSNNTWIRLRGTNYGVFGIVGTQELGGWAWSDTDTGWVSFNRVNCDANKDGQSDGVPANCPPLGTPISDYKVMTSFAFHPPNQPPIADTCCQSCALPSCTTYTGQVFTIINNSSDPDGAIDIVKSEWDILGWGSDPDLSCPNVCNYTPPTQILTAGTYTTELYVEDSQGESDTHTQPFTIKQSAIADFKCSLDNVNWKLCSSIKPNADEVVYFLNQSSPPQDGSITSYSWTFQNGSPATATGTNPSAKFQSAGSKQVTLTLGVTAGAPASETKTVFVQLPLPEWEEVAPF